jgi:hypothetical protein
MEQKSEYQKYNTSVTLLKALATIAVATEDEIQEALDIRPCEVYRHLTGKKIGEKYLASIIDSDLDEWEKTALQLSKVWQDIKMPIRKLLQWRHTDKSMVTRFKSFLEKF